MYKSKYNKTKLRKAKSLMRLAIQSLKPSNRISVSDSTSKLKIAADSGASYWDPTTTPYMIEPMNMLTSREKEAVIFVGPQRSGKTQALIDGWINYGIQHDPADMMVVFTTNSLARDFSIRRLSRMISYNSELKHRVLPGHNDNVFDKAFITGNMINLAWPSIGQLRQRDIRWAAVTELDSMTSDISGAGDIFGLLQKRTQTYLSSGMTLAESAPSKPINLEVLEEYTLQSNHDCYPAEGIATLYSMGDHRRLYWQCLNCDNEFQASMSNLTWEPLPDPAEAAETVKLTCSKCGHVHLPKDRFQLNYNLLENKGGWRPGTNPDGTTRNTKIVSYWLEGAAAAFQSWQDLVLREINAFHVYQETGDETLLKRTRNSDQGIQYLPPDWNKDRNSANLQARAEEGLEKIIPDNAHFLVTTVDVQKKRFVVQVQAYGRERECWIVNRYNITNSPTRVGEDGKPLPIEPFSYAEDWSVLARVLEQEYKTKDGAVATSALVLFDTGGGDKATENAYKFWRSWSKTTDNRKVLQPIKGSTPNQASKIVLSNAVLNKEGVPLRTVNVNSYKDEISFLLQRTTPGPGYIHFPSWLGEWFFNELQSERKNKKGIWEKIKKGYNNEALDLLAYSHAGYDLLTKKLNFDQPPDWAIRMGDRTPQRGRKDVDVDSNLDWVRKLAARNASITNNQPITNPIVNPIVNPMVNTTSAKDAPSADRILVRPPRAENVQRIPNPNQIAARPTSFSF